MSQKSAQLVSQGICSSITQSATRKNGKLARNKIIYLTVATSMRKMLNLNDTLYLTLFSNARLHCTHDKLRRTTADLCKNASSQLVEVGKQSHLLHVVDGSISRPCKLRNPYSAAIFSLQIPHSTFALQQLISFLNLNA